MRIGPIPDQLDDDQLVVRAILQRWDPIGSIKVGGPLDEYDDLIGPILAALASGITTDDLATELSQVMRTAYGLGRPKTECLVVARDLVKAGSRRRGSQ
ncbi:hypothetical protein [Lapillicoccus sp.]|uniref:hypothetical protein n=1 Tax=Lapillicoccus sp. TaxID=1909287 RepID=UPI00326382BB